jgi:hypothetical protein
VSYRSEAERIAALVGPRDLSQAVDASTDHALLVVLGEYARHVGLIERLQGVPIDQRQGEYTPQGNKSKAKAVHFVRPIQGISSKSSVDPSKRRCFLAAR